MASIDLAAYSSQGSKKQNYLSHKLLNFAPLQQFERAALDVLADGEVTVPKDRDVAVEGQVPRFIVLVKEGMAMRYHMLPDGGRQIISFLIPGDLCCVHAFLPRPRDHSIAAVTPLRVSMIPLEKMTQLVTQHPGIATGLSWSALQEHAILQERLISLGRRDARSSMAHLICELYWRHKAVGLANESVFRLPLTQTKLGDALGLTAVHVNRVMGAFYERQLIGMEQRRMCLLDLDRLQEIAGIDSAYLHFGRKLEDLPVRSMT